MEMYYTMTIIGNMCASSDWCLSDNNMTAYICLIVKETNLFRLVDWNPTFFTFLKLWFLISYIELQSIFLAPSIRPKKIKTLFPVTCQFKT